MLLGTVLLLTGVPARASVLDVLEHRGVRPCELHLTTRAMSPRSLFLFVHYRGLLIGTLNGFDSRLKEPWDDCLDAHSELHPLAIGKGVGSVMYVASATLFGRAGFRLISSRKGNPASAAVWARFRRDGRTTSFEVCRAGECVERHELHVERVFAADPRLRDFIRDRLPVSGAAEIP